MCVLCDVSLLLVTMAFLRLSCQATVCVSLLWLCVFVLAVCLCVGCLRFLVLLVLGCASLSLPALLPALLCLRP